MGIRNSNIYNAPGGQINTFEKLKGGIHFTPTTQSNVWQRAEEVVREYGSPTQTNDLLEMRRNVDAGDTVRARTIWANLKSVFDIALERGANIAQLVNTIQGFFPHGR